MNKGVLSVAISLMLIGMLGPVSFAQDEGNAPPRITDMVWEISRLQLFTWDFPWYGDWEPFDPDTELAHERDFLRMTATIVDPDWDGEDNDEEVFVRQQSLWLPYLNYCDPEPPPIPQDNDAFIPEEGDGFAPPEGETQITYAFLFEIPEFVGKNQARLREFIPYDVLWRIQFMVTNEQDPGCDEGDWVTGCKVVTGYVTGRCDSPVSFHFQRLMAIENTILAPPNPPAFADAGADVTVEAGQTVVLDASRTFDGFNQGFDPSSGEIIEKDTLTYAWEWISGPASVEPEQEDEYSPFATVVLDMVGDYVFRVTVDDNVGSLPDTDSIAITVVADIPDNRTPTADVSGPSGTIRIGDTITLDGSGSSDPDAGDTLSYYWRQTDELGGQLPGDELNRVFQPISGTQEAISTWQAVHAGTFYVRLLVSDGQLTDVSEILSLDVIEASTAGTTVRNDESAAPAAGEDAGQVTPAPMLCGAGAVSLTLVPFLLWPLRGRLRG